MTDTKTHTLASALDYIVSQVETVGMDPFLESDSEKNIKALFNTYRNIVRDSAVAPILLFNKRMQFSESESERRATQTR